VLRAERPSRLIYAAPVASADGVASIEALGVTTVIAAVPRNFQGVGEWYERFEQTSDEEVLALLAHAAREEF
jgi:putative phosphoribosyl transferase